MSKQAELDHAEAMRHANDGFAHRMAGRHDAASIAFRRAHELERRAAMSLLEDDLEPSRSILFQRAASLALHCGEHRDARRLAHYGLAGAPTSRVRECLASIITKAEAKIGGGVPWPKASDEMTVQEARFCSCSSREVRSEVAERARADGFDVYEYAHDLVVVLPSLP